MKEKIIKILKSHSYHHTEGVGVKSQFKYLAEIAFECCADEIMLALDQSKFTADEAEEHINQEVEKRIAERMPTIEDEERNVFKFSGNRSLSSSYFTGFFDACKWLRSRLSQKTEGGGE